MGNLLSDSNYCTNSQTKYLEASEIIDFGYQKKINWDNLLNTLAEKDEKISHIITEELLFEILNLAEFEGLRKVIIDGILNNKPSKIKFKIIKMIVDLRVFKYINIGLSLHTLKQNDLKIKVLLGLLNSQFSGYPTKTLLFFGNYTQKNNNIWPEGQQNPKNISMNLINKYGHDCFIDFHVNFEEMKFEKNSYSSKKIFIFLDSNFIIDKDKYPDYREFYNDIKTQNNNGKSFMIYDLVMLDSEQQDKGIKEEERSNLLETDSESLIQILDSTNENLRLLIEIIKEYFKKLAENINNTSKKIINGLDDNEKKQLKNIQTLFETFKYLKSLGKYNIEDLSYLHLSIKSKEKLLYKQIRNILTNDKKLNFCSDYILTAYGICVNLFSEDRSLIISSDCDIKIISDLIYNEIFPRYYAEVIIDYLKKELKNTTNFIKYLESIGFNNEEDYKKQAIIDSKIHMKYCNLSTKEDNYIDRENLLNIFNPNINRLYIYDIIGPLKQFLIGINEFVHGKSKIIIYAIEFRSNPIEILEIKDYLRKININEFDDSQKYKLLLWKILELKGKGQLTEIEPMKLKKILDDFFPQNSQIITESVKDNISNLIND